MKNLTLEEFWKILEAATPMRKKNHGLFGVLDYISVLYDELGDFYEGAGDTEQGKNFHDIAYNLLKEAKRRANA